MNLDSLSFALSNISYSVANLTKKNFKSSVQEISRLVSHHGLEAERHLLRCLFSHVDFSGDGKSSGKDFHQTQFLIQECAAILNKPNFVSTFCYAIDCPLQQQKSLRPSAYLLPQLSKVLKLSPVQEIAFGLALLNSAVSEHTSHASIYLKQKLPDFIKHLVETADSQSQDPFDLPPVILHLLLNHLLCETRGLEVSPDLKISICDSIQKNFKDKIPVFILPYSQSEKLDPVMDSVNNTSKPAEDSYVDVIQEMGYSFTAR
ncbi:LOW QUALITY PROTEIN: CCR4-NOT transcription complex subunit 1-like [Uloborus diversus]|uniref:LOW QUALITY PROTEIN: CCR4-NOT transcription complex subunit 1-like n=1 Tax=Uloborus diversus TaxID=327109 RepID=UPI00240991DB|nr:LOW QUALITY PROTEIN: CCR4-NOT transcription complex subunit 1-like [Uloborus diversus]